MASRSNKTLDNNQFTNNVYTHTNRISTPSIEHLHPDSTFPTILASCPEQQSMKMIASTKLNKAQRAMAAAKAYGAANNGKFRLSRLQQHSTHIAQHLNYPNLFLTRRDLHQLRGRCSRRWQAALHRRLLRQGSLRWYPLVRHQAHQGRIPEDRRLCR